MEAKSQLDLPTKQVQLELFPLAPSKTPLLILMGAPLLLPSQPTFNPAWLDYILPLLIVVGGGALIVAFVLLIAYQEGVKAWWQLKRGAFRKFAFQIRWGKELPVAGRSTTLPELGDWFPSQDELGFKPYVRLTVERIVQYARECQARPRKPRFKARISALVRRMRFRRDSSALTIGIYGEWGSGKSTFLEMLREQIEQEYEIDTIWLDAWKYNQEEQLWAALLQTLLSRAPSNRNILLRPWIKFRIWLYTLDLRAGSWEVFKHIAFPIFKGLILGLLIWVALDTQSADNFVNMLLPTLPWDLDVVAKVLLSIAGIIILPAEIKKGFDQELNIDLASFRRNTSYRSRIGFLNEFKDHFQWLIDLVYPQKPLVVIIDDLDRCLPQVAVQILEAIKLFLDVDRCVFVLGVNKELIADAILVQYKELVTVKEENSKIGTATPPLGVSILTFGATYLDRIIQHSFTIPPLDASTRKHFIKSLLSEEHREDDVVDVFIYGLEGNPRKIKQAIQLYLMWYDLRSLIVENEQLAKTSSDNEGSNDD